MNAARSFQIYSVLEPPERDKLQVKFMPGVQAKGDGALQAKDHTLSTVFIFLCNQCT